MAHRRQVFFRQKLPLYFNHNFPRNVVDYARSLRRLHRAPRISSASELGFEKRGDPFHFDYCKRNGYVLVTLDRDFMDDRKYPIARNRGVFYMTAGRGEVADIAGCLLVIAEFLARFPHPRDFVAQSKFQISREQCIMRGMNIKTGEVKIATINYGRTTVREMARAFGYF